MTLTVASVLLVLLGLLLPFWGFVVIGIVVAVVFAPHAIGRSKAAMLAVCLAVFADLFYGPAVGMIHALMLPFTVCTGVALGIRYFVMRDMREGVPTKL